MRHRFLVLLLIVGSTCFGQEPNEATPEVDKLLKNLGYDDSLRSMNASVIRTLKKTYQSANLPEWVWIEYEKALNSDEYLDISRRIYLEELTIEEMKAANAFFESPLGKSYSAKLGRIGERELLESRDWSQKLFASILRRYKETKDANQSPNQRPEGTSEKAPPSNSSQGGAVPHP